MFHRFGISSAKQPTLKIVMLLLAILFATITQAQQAITDDLIKKARQGNMYDLDKILDYTKTMSDALNVLSSLKKYHNDSSRAVKLMIFSAEYKIARSSNSVDIKRAASTSLSAALLDKDPFVWQTVSRQMSSFLRSEFSEEAKATIGNLIINNNVNRELILLAGCAELKSQIDKINQILIVHQKSSQASDRKLSWACHLALARLGVDSQLTYCLQKVRAEKDDVIRVTILLKDLAYTRQLAAIKEIQGYVEDENRLPSVTPGEAGAKYCSYAINILAQIIKDFPVNANSIYYTNDEIKICRQWIKENSNFSIIK